MTLQDLQINRYQLREGEFKYDEPFILERVGQLAGPDKWAIRHRGRCLDKAGNWDLELLPSNRDKEYIKNNRWDSAEEALSFWIEHKCKVR
jgi:hypothetical protein